MLFKHHFLLLCLVLILLWGSEISLYAQEFQPNLEVAYDIDWQPNGSVLAVAADNHVWLLDTEFAVLEIYAYPPTSDNETQLPRAVEWSPNGAWLATMNSRGWLHIWSYPDGLLIFNHRITESLSRSTIRWHPTDPLLSVGNQLVHVDSGIVEYPFTYDVYWGRSIDGPSLEQPTTGEVYWSPDGTHLIRLISTAGCNPCLEYGIFDVVSGELIESLGTNTWSSTSFVWSTDGRFRKQDQIVINDMLFNSQIERLVYVETGSFQYFRMPAIFVVNTFEDQDIINHQVVYPISLSSIDWTPNMPYVITALNCNGELLLIDIRDMSIADSTTVFAPYPSGDESVCNPFLLETDYANP